MKTIVDVLSLTEDIECQLGLVTEDIARILQAPASKRNGPLLREKWNELSAFRPQMRKANRSLKTLTKPRISQARQSQYLAQRAMYAQARAFQNRLRLWNQMESSIEKHIDPARTPLWPDELNIGADNSLLNHLYRSLHRLANSNPQDRNAEEYGCFPDIALPIKAFERLMSAAYRVALAQGPGRQLRFLDIGCGGGTKVLAAARYFTFCDGIDYDKGYAAAGQRTLQIVEAKDCAIFHADALSFSGYDHYDVIYFYRPMNDDAQLETLENRIRNMARPGTILITPYNLSLMARSDMKFSKVADPIFVTGLTQPEADQLRQDAEATCTGIIKRKSDFSFETGFWSPIIEAASFD